MKELKFLLDLAKTAAIEGGKEILKFYKKSEVNCDTTLEYKNATRPYEIYIKPDKSPVTQADLASNDKIFEILAKSGLPICSEEQILDQDAGEFWLIDPLDGTNDFISEVGEFCVCIALIKNSRPILGVIYVPIANELYFAAENLGSHYQKFEKFSPSQDENAIFAKRNLIDLINQTDKNLIVVSRYGKNKIPLMLGEKLNLEPLRLSSAIKFCKIAEGTAKIYARFSPSSIWDNAAGEIIAMESGAQMIDLKTKNPPLYQTQNLKSNEFIVISKDFIDKKDEILDFIKINKEI